MKTLASAAAHQEQGTAEDIQAESQLWSIIKMGFLGSQKLPHGPVSFFRPIRDQIFKQDFTQEAKLQKCTGYLTPTTGVAMPTDCAEFLMASIGKLRRNASSKDISILQVENTVCSK